MMIIFIDYTIISGTYGLTKTVIVTTLLFS